METPALSKAEQGKILEDILKEEGLVSLIKVGEKDYYFSDRTPAQLRDEFISGAIEAVDIALPKLPSDKRAGSTDGWMYQLSNVLVPSHRVLLIRDVEGELNSLN